MAHKLADVLRFRRCGATLDGSTCRRRDRGAVRDAQYRGDGEHPGEWLQEYLEPTLFGRTMEDGRSGGTPELALTRPIGRRTRSRIGQRIGTATDCTTPLYLEY